MAESESSGQSNPMNQVHLFHFLSLDSNNQLQFKNRKLYYNSTELQFTIKF